MLRAFVLISVLFVSGCQRPKEEAPKPKVVGFKFSNQSDGTKQVPRLIGRIAMVNEEGKFVLINCDAWATPPKGMALKCMRNGVETGVVNVTPERRGGFVAADIITGNPLKGDEAYQ